MTRFHLLRLSLIALALSAGASQAATPLPYNYIDVDLVTVDYGGGSETGFGVDGSLTLSDMFYAVASISDVDPVTSMSVGLGLHGALGQRLHAFGALRFLSVDAGAASDTGLILRGGLRGEVTPVFELYGQVDHVDVFGSADDSVTLGGYYYFSRVAIGAAYTSNDSADYTAVGLRFSF